VKWLLAAADQGLLHAQLRLAEMYADAPDISGSHMIACGWFPPGGKALARHSSTQGSIGIRTHRLAFDPGTNRPGETLRAGLGG